MGGAIRDGDPRHDEVLVVHLSHLSELDQMRGKPHVFVVGEGLWIKADELLLRAQQRKQPEFFMAEVLKKDYIL